MRNKNHNFYQLGALVKARREELGISQVKLSERLGYKSGQFVSNMERGLCSLPLEKVASLSIELQIPAEKILDRIVEDFRFKAKRVVLESDRV